jgi:lipopolysaccharide/colanic/teichoic acid biosynthesis glycosyltransferase
VGFDLLDINSSPKCLDYLNGKSKRFVDILGALVGILLGLPIFLVATLVVKLVDRVPALFFQERVGLMGSTFTILKLRTLRVIETREMVNPGRIQRKPAYETTKTGGFWRRTSIDEIIQFLLVLKGDMSLIGHRPIPKYYIPHLASLAGMDQAKVDHYLNVIYKYKPGMSSLSSVKGRGDLTMQEKMVCDLIYSQKASFSYDLKLLIRTLYVVLTQKGAM